jgi:hypothetical protein
VSEDLGSMLERGFGVSDLVEFKKLNEDLYKSELSFTNLS